MDGQGQGQPALPPRLIHTGKGIRFLPTPETRWPRRADPRGGANAQAEDSPFSAVALREPTTREDLYTPISDEELGEAPFHAVMFTSQSETHTLVTEELSTWFLDQLP